MEVYRINISDLAKKDIQDTVTYIANEFQESAVAEKTSDTIVDAIFTLEEMPDRICLVKDKRLAERIRSLYINNIKK